MRSTEGRGSAQTAAPTVALGALVLFAWVGLSIWGASPYARYLGHGEIAGEGPQVVGVALFLVGWMLMIAAMMLPTVIDLLDAFGRVTMRRPDRRRLMLLLITGFLMTWGCVGGAFQVFDDGVHAVVAAVEVLESRPRLVAAAVLLVAGAYQFMPLKRRCLTACRTPRSFVMRHWRGGRPEADALRIGMVYGVSCVGCCWALMLMLFALGSASVVWMLAVGAVMAAEKLTPRGASLSWPLGAALIVTAIVVALG